MLPKTLAFFGEIRSGCARPDLNWRPSTTSWPLYPTAEFRHDTRNLSIAGALLSGGFLHQLMRELVHVTRSPRSAVF